MNARITVADVLRIRSMSARGASPIAIAHAIGCSRQIVKRVLAGKTWARLDAAEMRRGTR